MCGRLLSRMPTERFGRYSTLRMRRGGPRRSLSRAWWRAGMDTGLCLSRMTAGKGSWQPNTVRSSTVSPTRPLHARGRSRARGADSRRRHPSRLVLGGWYAIDRPPSRQRGTRLGSAHAQWRAQRNHRRAQWRGVGAYRAGRGNLGGAGFRRPARERMGSLAQLGAFTGHGRTFSPVHHAGGCPPVCCACCGGFRRCPSHQQRVGRGRA